MNTAIVVPIHNAPEYVERVLGQIHNFTPAWTPLVVVDDASDEKTKELLKEASQSLLKFRTHAILTNERQQLFTRTVNRGVRYAYRHFKPEAIAIVNSDCDLKPGWLSKLEEGLASEPSLGIVGYRDQPDPKAKGLITRERMPSYITGHCLLIKTEVFEKVGVFCETDVDGRDSPELRHLHGQAHIGSERILGWRSMQVGFGCAYVNYPGVYHEAGKSWGHDLHWLANFDLQSLWKPCDTLEQPEWYDRENPDI